MLWVVFWLYGYFSFSVLAMFVLLYSLLKIVMNNQMELWDAPISVIAFLWWPFVFYSGWITVASIANVAAYLTSIGWNGWGISASTWAVIMIIVAGILNLAVTWRRNMREFALVGAWGFSAICVAQWGSTNAVVSYTALVMAAVLIISSAYHGYLNRSTNPGQKLKEYFQKK
jgi:hypothetical protein